MRNALSPVAENGPIVPRLAGVWSAANTRRSSTSDNSPSAAARRNLKKSMTDRKVGVQRLVDYLRWRIIRLKLVDGESVMVLKYDGYRDSL